MHLNRRSFLKSVLAGIAVASIGPTLPKVAVAMDPCPHNKDGVCTCGMTFHRDRSILSHDGGEFTQFQRQSGWVNPDDKE